MVESVLCAASLVRRQMVDILCGWGMEPDRAETTADVLVWADLRGVDSHGLAMVAPYGRLLSEGSIVMMPTCTTVTETATTATLDAGGGLGHVASVRAMNLAIEKAKSHGMGAVAVRNSHHFGAAGYYAEMAVRERLIGTAYTSVHRPTVVPTFGAAPMFGTNPIAFAAPAARNPPFFLDMATSTSALGKLLVAARAGKPLPAGVALGKDGKPEQDPRAAFDARMLTPLGSTPELASHKGYGLAVMVEILCTTLSGACFGASRGPRKPSDPWNVGHFFLVIDPAAFRPLEAFESDMDEMIDALHATPAISPDDPVLVAGDPERAACAQRMRDGIPVSPELREDIRSVAKAAGVPFLL